MKLLMLCLFVAFAQGGLAPLYLSSARGIPNSYVVKIKDVSMVDQVAEEIENLFSKMRTAVTKLTKIRLVMPALTIRIPPYLVHSVRAIDGVEYVEQDKLGQLTATQLNPTWGLDRIDQRSSVLDDRYTSLDHAQGDGVNIYVIDTGIQLYHAEFGGRVTLLDGKIDDWGHGTHCAGTAGGSTYGIARKAYIYSAKACELTGCPLTQFTEACEYILNHGKKGVVSISINYYFSPSVTLDVQGMIDQGLVVSVAAGNDNSDACQWTPMNIKDAITVGATDNTDTRAYFSNWGSCLDIFAPGVNIVSAGMSSSSNDKTETMSGTSMACPHVSGVAALYIGVNPHLTQDLIKQVLLERSTPDVVHDTRGSPNLLLYSLGA